MRMNVDEWLASWPDRLEARDNAFLFRLANEIAALDALGYSKREQRAALAGRLYIRAWAACPRWLEHIDKLPPPLKWAQGVTYKRPKAVNVRTLVHGDALFIRYTDNGLVGMQMHEKPVLVIHGIKARTLPELIDGLPNGAAIDWALTQFAIEHGLRLTNNHIHLTRKAT